MLKTSVAAVAAGFLFSSAALAQSAADTVERAGLLGRWSRDCAQSSQLTPHITYARVAGATQQRMDYVGHSIVMMVENVRILAANSVALRLKTPPGEKEPDSHEIVLTIEGNRYRAMSSVNSAGKVHIRDGVLVASGNPSPWHYRCN